MSSWLQLKNPLPSFDSLSKNHLKYRHLSNTLRVSVAKQVNPENAAHTQMLCTRYVQCMFAVIVCLGRLDIYLQLSTFLGRTSITGKIMIAAIVNV